jgi:hypothetical protein
LYFRDIQLLFEKTSNTFEIYDKREVQHKNTMLSVCIIPNAFYTGNFCTSYNLRFVTGVPYSITEYTERSVFVNLRVLTVD